MAITACPVLKGSVTLVTIPSKEQENQIKLPMPVFTSLEPDIGTLMDVEKHPVLNQLTPEPITLIVTPPLSDMEGVPFLILYRAPKQKSKAVNSLQVPKNKKTTLPKRASPPISKQKITTTTAEHAPQPSVGEDFELEVEVMGQEGWRT